MKKCVCSYGESRSVEPFVITVSQEGHVDVSLTYRNGTQVTRRLNRGGTFTTAGATVKVIKNGAVHGKVQIEVSKERTKKRSKQLRRLCKQSRPLKLAAMQSQEEFDDDEFDPAELED